MVRDIIRSAKPALGAAVLAAALFMVPSERAAANCPWDELLLACYYTLPSSNCATGSVCDCKGEGNEFHWPCNVSYCADATPLPCGPDPQFSGRGEDSDAVAADSGIALNAKPVPDALKIWNSPEFRAKRAAAVLLQRGASEEDFRAECLEDTQACLESVPIRVSDEYTLQYALKDTSGDQVIISRGEEQVKVMEIPEKRPATE